ncbi:hypothetical protein MXD81_18545, partial [Microbacteriaceae bacterium K1510]|nr:hypothetical protein [Microbacteriaceae bacterium K1510]
ISHDPTIRGENRGQGVRWMATNKRSERGRNHPSDTLYDQPAGTIAHKARYGASEVSKQPNANGDLPNKPGGDVRT